MPETWYMRTVWRICPLCLNRHTPKRTTSDTQRAPVSLFLGKQSEHKHGTSDQLSLLVKDMVWKWLPYAGLTADHGLTYCTQPVTSESKDTISKLWELQTLELRNFLVDALEQVVASRPI